MVDTARAVPHGPASITTREELVAALDTLRRHGPDGNPRARVTLQSLAKATDIPVSTVHSYLSGRTLPPPDALDAIVWVLGVRGRERGAWADALDRVQSSARRPTTDAAPRTMGPPLRDFVGRAELLVEMDRQWERSAGRSPLLLLTGTGGIGKTSLALEWAHRHIDDFPDGSLQVDLRGFGQQEPMSAARAQRLVLTALGVPSAQLPTDPDELTAAYNSQLSGRRSVLLLDNVRDSHQAEQLVPSAPHVTTILTSRDTLRALAVSQGVTAVRVPVMDANESRILLAHASGSQLDAAQLGEVAEVCAGLPLALRLSADAVAGQGSTVRDALSLIVDGVDHGVRGVIDSSVHALSPEARDLFVKLGTIPGRWISQVSAEVVSGPDHAQLYWELVSVNLFEPRMDGWVRHDLVTDAATAWADADTSSHVLRGRLLAHYTRVFRRSLGALRHFLQPLDEPRTDAPGAAGAPASASLVPEAALPDLTDTDAAVVRVRELDAFLGLVTWALDHDHPLSAAAGLDVLASGASQHGGFQEFHHLLRRLANDSTAPVAARWVAWRGLAREAYVRGDWDAEAEDYRAGLDLVRSASGVSPQLELAASCSLGTVLVRTGQQAEGEALLVEAIERATALGEHAWRSFAENSLGVVSHYDPDAALLHYDAAIAAADAGGLPELAVLPLVNAAQVAQAQHKDGDDDAWLVRAERYLDRMDALAGEGDVNVRTTARGVRALIALSRGDLDSALEMGEEAAAAADEGVATWNRREAQWTLGTICAAAGMLTRAREHLEAAIELSRTMNDVIGEAHVRIELAQVDLAGHDPISARHALEALRAQMAGSELPDHLQAAMADLQARIDALEQQG